MSYPKNMVFQNPNGTWGFVGRVDVRLSWIAKDGSEVTPELAERIARASCPGMIAKTRVFKSKQDAIDFAKGLGLEVSGV